MTFREGFILGFLAAVVVDTFVLYWFLNPPTPKGGDPQ